MQNPNIRLENIKKLIRRDAKGPIYNILNKLHPADLAYVITNLQDIDRKKIWSYLHDRSRIAEIILELSEDDMVEIVSNMEPELASEVLIEMESDDVAYVLRLLPEEVKENILQHASDSEIIEVEELLHYPERTAGAMMNTKFLVLKDTTTIKEATKLIHRSEDIEMLYYLYVINKEERLVGVLSLRQLILNPPEKTLADVMTKETIYVLDSTDREEVAHLVDKYNFLALPVLDREHRMVGIITFDDVIDVIIDEATEDIYRMTGTSKEAISHDSPPVKSVKARLPWLVITLIGEMLSGVVVVKFQGDIVDFAILASFMPVIMAMGGNVGSQSSTIIIRSAALGKIDPKKSAMILWKEIRVGFLMGAVMAIPVFFIAPAVHAGPLIGPIVATSLFAVMTFAAFSGTFVPLMLSRVGIDPAVASGPFISTLNDITGLTIYFSVAILFFNLFT